MITNARTEDWVAFGRRLRQRREELNMSIAEAAVAAGCSSAAIIQYELGNRVPRLSIIAPLLRVYRVSLEHLLFGTSKDVAA